jgi:hypothetical protein
VAFEPSDEATFGTGARVEARCAWCGPVRLAMPALAMHVASEREGLVEFRCSECDRLNVLAIGRGDLRALLVAGLRPASGSAPFELLEEHVGPPIGWDDLIDFHEALARSDPRTERTFERPDSRGPDHERNAA